MQAGTLMKALAGLVFATGMVVPAAAITALPAHAAHALRPCDQDHHNYDGTGYSDSGNHPDPQPSDPSAGDCGANYPDSHPSYHNHPQHTPPPRPPRGGQG